jgi:hypothetical protein
MLRRFLCLGAVLLALVLGAAGCGQNKTRNTVPVVPDPDGGARPSLRGG